jgi:DNA-binding NtrC family response regulator
MNGSAFLRCASALACGGDQAARDFEEGVMTAQVVLLRDNEVQIRFGIDRAQVCIGTNLSNDIVLEGDDLFPLSAVLIVRGGKRYTLRDFSHGMLKLRGLALESNEAELSENEIFELGRYQLFVDSRADRTPIRRHGENTRQIPREDGEPLNATVLHQGRRHRISTTMPFNIGRHSRNDLVLEDPDASSEHCSISYEDGRWVLQDLGSANGTFINDLKLSPGRIHFSRSIAVKVGTSRLSIELLARAGTSHATEPRMLHGMVAESEELRAALALLESYAKDNELVLILGEYGCGKELVARAIHEASDRRNGPYVVVDAGRLSSTLIENDLFGHVKGAFTGAVGSKLGAFEDASGGTLFLDEIGELPLDLQPQLLRVLETYSIRRIGENREVKVDTRVVAATNKDLYAMVQQGKFRRDLYDRLFMLVMEIPPLRERPADILPTARYFMRKMKPDRDLRLSEGAEELLLGYAWPGNVRELRGVLQRSFRHAENDIISLDALKFSGRDFTDRSEDVRNWFFSAESRDRAALIDALEKTNGNKTRASELLGISRTAVHGRINRYGLKKRENEVVGSSEVRQPRAEDGRPKRRSAFSDTQMSRATELMECPPRSTDVRSGGDDEAPTLHAGRFVALDRRCRAGSDSGPDDRIDTTWPELD